MNPFEVLVRPLLSEKSNNVREMEKPQYSFQVKLDATKRDVEKAVEKLFNVKVESVNTAITRGKIKRRGNQVAKNPNVKKAIVTLAGDAKIGLFSDL